MQDKKRLITASISLVCMFLFFIWVFFVFCNTSFGWFSSNKTTSAHGMSVQAADSGLSFQYSLDNGANWKPYDLTKSFTMAELFKKDAIRPGDSATVMLKVLNSSSNDYTVKEFGLCCIEDSDETPITVDGTEYRLGTQISAVLGATPDNSHSGGDSPVVTNAIWKNNSGTRNLVGTSGETISAKQGETNGELVFTVTLTFVETEVDQNVYQGFGSQANGSKGICRRAFYIVWI